MTETIMPKEIYHGKTLKEAYDNCMSDQACYGNHILGYDIINARRLGQNIITGFAAEPQEAWEFELFLCYK